jgi:hypothetical protein
LRPTSLAELYIPALKAGVFRAIWIKGLAKTRPFVAGCAYCISRIGAPDILLAASSLQDSFRSGFGQLELAGQVAASFLTSRITFPSQGFSNGSSISLIRNPLVHKFLCKNLNHRGFGNAHAPC